MKPNYLVLIVLLFLFSCKKNESRILDAKSLKDAFGKYSHNWITIRDSIYIIKTQNLYYGKDTVWNQLKIYKSNKLDTSRSYYFEKSEKQGFTELFYKPAYWHNFPIRKSYLRKAKNYQLIDSIKINIGKNTLNMLLKSNEKTGEIFDIVTHYYDSVGYYKSTRMYLLE